MPTPCQMALPLAVYSITFILGLLGNTLILVAVGRQNQVRHNLQHQSPANNFHSCVAASKVHFSCFQNHKIVVNCSRIILKCVILSYELERVPS